MLRSIVAKVGRRGIQQQSAAFSSVHESILAYDTPSAPAPLVQHYRPRWPQPPITKPAEEGEFLGIMPVPVARAIDPKVLNFEMTATFAHGSSIYYEHMLIHPSDFKVRLRVLVKDLNLTDAERWIFIRMVGFRYNATKQSLKLVTTRFPNRIENKRYLVYLLENLVMEAQKLAVIQQEELVELAAAAEAAAAASLVAAETAANAPVEEIPEGTPVKAPLLVGMPPGIGTILRSWKKPL